MESDQMSDSSYYRVLGVNVDSSDEEIRRAYRKLAMQWHPDKWTRTPSLLGEAKRKFQQIQEAYAVLSDQRKRAMYNAGLYDSFEEDDGAYDEGFSDFLQEMVSLMDEVRREDKSYSMEELQFMFVEMAKGFEFPEWSYSPQFQWPPTHESPHWGYEHLMFDDRANSKRSRCEANSTDRSSSRLHVPGFEMY